MDTTARFLGDEAIANEVRLAGHPYRRHPNGPLPGSIQAADLERLRLLHSSCYRLFDLSNPQDKKDFCQITDQILNGAVLKVYENFIPDKDRMVVHLLWAERTSTILPQGADSIF